MTTCIRCGGPDAPSEVVMCPSCMAAYLDAVACGPLSADAVAKFKAFFEETAASPRYSRIEIIAARSSPARGTVGEVDAALTTLGTVRRWSEKTPGRPYTITVWMKWSPRPTWADVRELREVLRYILPVFERARIMAVPRRRR